MQELDILSRRASIFLLALLTCSSASESNKRNPPRRHLELSFFFRYEVMTSLKRYLPHAQCDSLTSFFRATFAALLALNYCSREFPKIEPTVSYKLSLIKNTCTVN